MKNTYISILAALLLLTGCTGSEQKPDSTDAEIESTAEPTPDPEAERQARIYQAMHSELLNECTQKIADGTDDPNDYLVRGDEYFRIASTEDYYDAYDYANKDYIIAFNLGGDLSDHAEKIVKIYEVKAEKCRQEDNVEDYMGYLQRAQRLVSSEERRTRINQLQLEFMMENAGKEIREDYHDDQGNLVDYYTISKYDDKGFRYELSTYRGDDTLVDTYDKYEYDSFGNCLLSATFNTDSLKFEQERRCTYTDDGTEIEVKYYIINTDHLLGSQVNDYDALGRWSGYHYIDSMTGQSAGYTVFLYDENDSWWATDSYKPDGTLAFHELAESD